MNTRDDAMNSLDSRSLRYGDTFAQKFSRSGKYIYDFGLPGLSHLDKSDGAFTLEVKESAEPGRSGKQYYVVVRRGEGGKRLEADPKELSISAGDVVLWSAADSSVPGFTVNGRSEKDSFNSAALTREAIYTHAFGSSGEVTWQDANGRRVGGKIVVKDVQTKSAEEFAAYRSRLNAGVLITISGAKVDPPQVEITVGQTVVFAVEKAEGIAITDQRLNIDAPAPSPDPQTGAASSQ